ncbi:MAG TPA: cytochrome c oxidase subunit 3 family protein [Blastocatellia bacterium]|nr:cytochrome c oxidase subunit 3 family protein [Blastocatellia bacterium]
MSYGLAHHFDSVEQQREAGTLGMWAFLVTEILFFGGMFMAYILYRTKDPVSFAAASHHLEWPIGAFNTGVLILSSLTMALAVYFSQTGNRRMLILCLILTMILGATFLGVKSYEYHEKYTGHLIPGFNFRWEGPGQANHVEMFYFLYFAMTGVHALHMIVGLGIMTVITTMAWRGRFTEEYHSPVEISGLYWHFVDIVWIFLFPLLYLLGAHVH